MMEKKKGYMTLAEHHAQLKAEGKWDEYLARKQAQEDAHQKLLEQRAKEAAPVVLALRDAGVIVESIWDLSDGRRPEPKAISVLFDQLKLDYPDHVREGILRALATPHARDRWDELVDIFEHNAVSLSPSIRYVAALALSGAADNTVLDDVIRLVVERRLGFDRAPLLLALVRLKSPKAKMTLMELQNDPDLGKEIKKIRRLKRRVITD